MQLRGEPLRTLSVPLSKPRALTLPVWVSFDVRDADGVFLHVVKRLEGIEAADVVRYGFMRVPLLDMLPDNSSRYLDEHFGFPVVEKIEEANEYFRTRLHALLDAA
jgi:hypothetical protein